MGAYIEDDMMALYVRDTGIGISERDLGRLGMPFVQADSGYNRRHEGAGLGLSVVKGLATLHGGSMRIESKLDEGTCVTIRLPLQPQTGSMQPTVVQLPTGEQGQSGEAFEPAVSPSRPQHQRRA